MQCPICKNQILRIQEMEPNLKTHECPNCKGQWIGSFYYWKWKESTGRTLQETSAPASEAPQQEPPLSVNDNSAAKLCPECGHFLRRYPVAADMGFSLDRCGNCGGTWFDNNEWLALKVRGLHDDVHLIFSNMWQNRIRDLQQQKAAETIYTKLFGPEDFGKIRQIKDWINQHPHRSELKAFLNG